jgi:hypothetical protein
MNPRAQLFANPHVDSLATVLASGARTTCGGVRGL